MSEELKQEKEMNAQEDEKKQTEEKPEPKKEEAADKAEEKAAEKAENKESGESVEDAVKKAEAAEKAAMDRLIRLQADFENYKKRTAKEKSEIAAYTTEGLIKKLLPVIDNLERAEAAADNEEESSSYRDGVKMVFDELVGVLKDEGLKEIEAEGKPFDPQYHHGVAVGNEEDVDDQVILEVFQKGYLVHDKVIRPAMVKINQK